MLTPPFARYAFTSALSATSCLPSCVLARSTAEAALPVPEPVTGATKALAAAASSAGAALVTAGAAAHVTAGAIAGAAVLAAAGARPNREPRPPRGLEGVGSVL